MPDETSACQSESAPPGDGACAAGRVELLVTAGDWNAADLPAVARRAGAAALTDNAWTAQGADFAGSELSLELADDARVAELNASFRGKAGPTNVLSFPGLAPEELSAALAAGRAGPPLPIGDVILAYETAAREAAEQGKPLSHHLAHLIVHGTLHCLGYDHQGDDEAAIMEEQERGILARLGVPDPYRGRAATAEATR